MEQLDLFSPFEEAKNNTFENINEFQFSAAAKEWEVVKVFEPENEYHSLIDYICTFWMNICPNDNDIWQLQPAIALKHWWDFEHGVKERGFQESMLIKRIKIKYFFSLIGLETIDSPLRNELFRHGISTIDLLMELSEWKRAEKEFGPIEEEGLQVGINNYLLKKMRIYEHLANQQAANKILFLIMIEEPECLSLHDIEGKFYFELLEDFANPESDSEEIIELLPAVGLLHGFFLVPLQKKLFLERLSDKIDQIEDKSPSYEQLSELQRFRLFSLYAWKSELLKMMGQEYIPLRQRMKVLAPRQFEKFMSLKHI